MAANNLRVENFKASNQLNNGQVEDSVAAEELPQAFQFETELKGTNYATGKFGINQKADKESVVLKSYRKTSDSSTSNTAPKQELREFEQLVKPKGLVRHVVAVLALTSIILANMNRQAFNQSLVSMTKQITVVVSEHQLSDTNNSRPSDFFTSLPTKIEHSVTTESPGFYYDTERSIGTTSVIIEDELLGYDDRFYWTNKQIAALQSAFSYGYTPFMIPGGRMSEMYGAKWVVFISGFGSALCCILCPLLADTNFYLLVASRVLMGLCQTGVSPALYALLVRWLTPEESSVYLPMIKVGVMLGFMSGSLISGFTRWRTTFYFVGLIGFLWSILWAYVVTSDPTDNRFVSEGELEHIRLGIVRVNKGRTQSMGAARRTTAPWFNIFTNPAVIAFTFTKFTVKFSTDAQTMQLPMCLRKVFDVSTELSIFTGLVAWVANEMVKRKTCGFNKTHVRRIFQGASNFGMATGYILIAFNLSGLEVVCFAIIILSISAMFGAGGEAVTPVDLSLEYSATIMAIANSAANLSGIVLPNIVSWALDERMVDTTRWTWIWLMVGLVMILGGLSYTCGLKAEIQDFRGSRSKSKSDKDNLNAIQMTDMKQEMVKS